MKKNYKQELSDLQSGLTSLNNLVKLAKDRKTTNKALINIPIQEARIEFFKNGYNFRNRELKEQVNITKRDNPFKDGCGGDIYTEKKGAVYCGDSEGFFCDKCKLIKELIKDVNRGSKKESSVNIKSSKQTKLKETESLSVADHVEDIEKEKKGDDARKLINIRGKKTPDHIFLRINRGILKTIPDEFYMDLTIDSVRNGVRG